MRNPDEIAARMRLEMPYGIWTCADGREVLFNRRYHPIWQRMPGQAATRAKNGEWVTFERESWFYTDSNPPWSSRKTKKKCKEVLAKWGCVEAEIKHAAGEPLDPIERSVRG